jgi:hypothetical protein
MSSTTTARIATFTARIIQDFVPDNIVMGEWNGHLLDLSKLAPGEEVVSSNPVANSQHPSTSTEMSQETSKALAIAP